MITELQEWKLEISLDTYANYVGKLPLLANYFCQSKPTQIQGAGKRLHLLSSGTKDGTDIAINHCRLTLYHLSHQTSGKDCVLAGKQTQVNCLEGSYSYHYTTNVTQLIYTW